ncbi:MAG TPA: amidohydrolase [Chloroflexota bacterium]|nr:amidohydrolase [Chloroflexota bacterium]
MRLLIANASVVTVNPQDDVLPNGFVVVEDGAILSVSPDAPEGEFDRRINGSGKVLMPGLVNAHTHLFQTLIRGVYEHLPFTDWLRRIYACGRVLTPEDCFVSAKLGALESLRSGVTTLVDHHFLNRGTELPSATIAGMGEIGLRRGLARTIMDLGDLAPAEVLETAEDGLRSTEQLLDQQRHERLLSLMTGPNTPGASASAELARDVQAWARDHDMRVSMHVAESRGVTDAVRQRTSHEGVVAWLDAVDALDPNVLAAHSVHLTPQEVAIYAQRGVSVSHNPVSNMFLGDGIAPVVEMLEAGVNVALGTDGAASNNSQDLFEVLKMAPLLQRARTLDPHVISPAQAIRMATVNGARALGLDHLTGSVEPGKRADLLLLDLRGAAHTVAVHDVLSQIVYCARPSNVDMVMVDGRVLLEGGEVVGLDELAFLADAQAAGEDLVRRLQEAG